MTEYKEEHKLYPTLPSAPIDDSTAGHSYRLHKISEIQKQLENEREKRESLSKKYNRSKTIVDATDATFVVVSMGLGAAGIGLLSTVIAAPLVIIIEGAAIVTGILSMAGMYVGKQLSLKAEKHEKIKVLAESKLNTIADHISKALTDNRISDEEFTLILSELEKYKQMKKELRTTIKTRLDENTKQSFINRGRNETREMIEKLFIKNNINTNNDK
jgi:hypothetical protein